MGTEIKCGRMYSERGRGLRRRLSGLWGSSCFIILVGVAGDVGWRSQVWQEVQEEFQTKDGWKTYLYQEGMDRSKELKLAYCII